MIFRAKSKSCSLTGCEMILIQAYSYEVWQRSMIDRSLRNNKKYDLFNGPFLGAKQGFCHCGCGAELTPRKYKWIDSRHSWLTYQGRRILKSPGNSLARIILHILQGGECNLCREDLPLSEGELDHRIEVNEGGGGCWLDNLQNLCRECHRRKTDNYIFHLARKRRGA